MYESFVGDIKTTYKKLSFDLPKQKHGERLIVCHPDNFNIIKQYVSEIRSYPDIHTIHNYTIVQNKYCPKTQKTGKILFKKNRFVDYSKTSTKADKKEYIEMCLYFGWAKEEEKEVFYEINPSLNSSILDMYSLKVNRKNEERILYESYSTIPRRGVFY